MSKVEGGVRLTPLPSRLRVTIFSSRLLGLNCNNKDSNNNSKTLVGAGGYTNHKLKNTTFGKLRN